MASILPGYEYDIFISYRHNDNRSGWVTEFVKHLNEELAATIKEPVSVYFDSNPYDGLLDTHNVDKSLEGKLKCLIFIPIISQTYCDSKSFAWQNEFCAFNALAKDDQFGIDVKLGTGNVASRILLIRIHDLDSDDKAIIENEIGGALRSIDFVFKTPGVNRPLTSGDKREENLNKTVYKDQVNKVANAVKDLIHSLSTKKDSAMANQVEKVIPNKTKNIIVVAIGAVILLALVAFVSQYFVTSKTEKPNEVSEILDRAEKYLEEAGRFDDMRYLTNAQEAIQKVLYRDSLNERALYLLSETLTKPDTVEYYVKELFRINPTSKYTFLTRAGFFSLKGNFPKALQDLQRVEQLDPENKDALRSLSFMYMITGDYLNSWKSANRYEQVAGEGHHEIMSYLYLELGDFKEAKRQLNLKKKLREFSCQDIEMQQRIYLCEGDFEGLEQATDSICEVSKCDRCPYWKLRAKMHVKKFAEAATHVRGALKNYGPSVWRYPAYVLNKVGRRDSSEILLNEELKLDNKRLTDTSYHQSFPMYSLSAIHAMHGNSQESLKWLRQYADKGFELGSEWYIAHDPLFDEMQKNNEYFADFMQIIQKAQAKKITLREKIREMEESGR